jgi:DNA-directed RNA polymerase specialized sigma24 family protein
MSETFKTFHTNISIFPVRVKIPSKALIFKAHHLSSMRDDHVVKEENFQILLDWLDGDRETAGQKYESIRRALIRIFAARGCHEAETLADRTIDRVAEKAPSVVPGYVGEPALYFYGVAHKMMLEWLRVQERAGGPVRTESIAAPVTLERKDAAEFACLETCLSELPRGSRELILDYYADDKRAKIIRRKKLADDLGITTSALQIRVSRIRSRLHGCIAKCLVKKG